MKKAMAFLAALLLCVTAALYLVPYHGRRASPAGLPPLTLETPAIRPTESELLDLNTAGAEELMTLPDIGPGRAEAILQYRSFYGPFRSVEELAAVEGIGAGVLETVRAYVCVSEDQHSTGR